jgi:hypothetical protein
MASQGYPSRHIRVKESSMLSPEEKLRLLSMVDILEPLSREG